MAEKTLPALLSDLRKKYQTVVGKVESLRLARDQTANAPLAREEMIEQIESHVERIAANFSEAVRTRLNAVATRPEDFTVDGERLLSRTGDERFAVLDHGAATAGALVIGLGPECVKSKLISQVDALELQHGLPAEARAKRLAELDEQIAKAEAEITEQRQSAASQGIFLEA